MKAFRFLLAALLSACLLAVPAWATDIEPGTGRDFFVRDTANVLSSDTEDTIIDYNAALEEQCSGAQLVVVTVSYLDGDADIAATRLMNDWGVGDAAQSNGMLLLLVANEHRGWLTVGAASRFSRMRRWGYGGGFFPIFWFGGGRRYRTYRNQFRPQPPPPPPGGFGGSTPPPPRRTTSFHSSRPTGGFTRGVGGGRSSGGFHSGGFHGGGGGHSGGGGGGRR